MEQIYVEEDEIEESINEEILEEGERSYGKNHKSKKDNGPEQYNQNPFNRQPSMKNNNATPNTILSNKQKLDRGISGDSDSNFNNGTMLNFGLAGQSTRSTFMKTPLMFGQNAHAKLRDINN